MLLGIENRHTRTHLSSRAVVYTHSNSKTFITITGQQIQHTCMHENVYLEWQQQGQKMNFILSYSSSSLACLISTHDVCVR